MQNISQLCKIKLSRMLKTLNLFPESRFFKVKKSEELDHKCGGISSLFILSVCLAVLVVKLFHAIRKDTVLFSSQKNYNIIPQMATLNTFQNDSVHKPYMLAIHHNEYGGCFRMNVPRAFHYSYEGIRTPNYTVTRTNITLERCTAEHFSLIPQIRDKAAMLGLGSWWCLPLNQTYQIGGHFSLSSVEKSISLNFQCNQSCYSTNCGNIAIYQLSTTINPQDNNNPFEYALDRSDLELTMNTYQQYISELNEIKVETDQSLLPLINQKNTKTSISHQPLKERFQLSANSLQRVELWLERSSSTIVVQRRFLSLLDVLSYVGGIFPSLFGLFFFMKFFGIYFFQMSFAYQHFKCDETQEHTFNNFLKRFIYRTLKNIGCEIKSWKIAKRQVEIKSIVSRVLQISYLFKRIQFLEKAISILFDQHQLKGIYLSQVTLKQAHEDYRKRQLRDRIVKYLHRKAIRTKLKKENERIATDDELNNEKNIQFRKKKTNLECEELGGSFSRLESSKKRSEENQKVKVYKQGQFIELELSQEELKRRDHQNLIAKESSMIQLSDQKQLDEEQLDEELEYDLKKLFRDARRDKGDEKSKKIVGSLDQHLRMELERVIDQFEEQNPRFQYRLATQKNE